MKKLPNKLPSNYRIITENPVITKSSKKWSNLKAKPKVQKTVSLASLILTLVLIVILASLTIFLTFKFSQNLDKYTNLANKREIIVGKINFWKSINSRYDGYADAYLNISSLYFQLKDYKNARNYIDTALLLNPDSKEASVLDNKLKKIGY
jgi:tetratricopeptide (TPR) repeat protein